MRPVSHGSVEINSTEKVPFVFFVIVANPEAGINIPFEFKVAEVVLGQKFGDTIHAGIVIEVASVMK